MFLFINWNLDCKMDLNRSSVLLLDNWILCKKVNSKQERERETKGESYYISSENK